MFSINALFFGDHLDLAKRCLGSILAAPEWDLIEDIRIGLNAVSPATYNYILAACAELPVTVRLVVPSHNVGKYPLMRRMFGLPRGLIPSDAGSLGLCMWFDDDSYLTNDRPGWWRVVHDVFMPATGPGTVCQSDRTAAMLGSIFLWTLRGNQEQGIRAQPWYTGRTFPPGFRVKFATGGWWVAPRSLLERYDYPFPELYHNGGDVMFGELLRQQGVPLINTKTHPAVHAGVRVNAAERRGLHTQSLWTDYDPARSVDLSHHDFDVEVIQAGHGA